MENVIDIMKLEIIIYLYFCSMCLVIGISFLKVIFKIGSKIIFDL